MEMKQVYWHERGDPDKPFPVQAWRLIKPDDDQSEERELAYVHDYETASLIAGALNISIDCSSPV